MNAASPISPPQSSALALGRPAPPTGSLWKGVAIAILAVGIEQVYLSVSSSLAVVPSTIGALLVPLGIFGMVPLLARWEGRPLREYGFTVRGGVAPALLYVSLFALLFLTIWLEPGFVFGFGAAAPLSSLGFGFSLLYGPVIALEQCAIFLGVLFRRLVRHLRFVQAMVVTSVFFGLASTNLPVLARVSLDLATQTVFTTTFTSLVLGVVLALYFYKSQWSLVGPVALEAAILCIPLLMPVGARQPGWEDAFATYLIAYVAVLIAVDLLMQEPRLQAQKYLGRAIGPRRFRFRERAENRRVARDIAVVAVALVAIVGTAEVALPAVAGTPSTPILAIATYSMVPTFERGTLVLIEKASPEQIHVGTIIAFHVTCLPSPTVHRVYKILVSGPSPVYLTKGDANPSPDPCDVPYSHVLGRAVLWVPYVGYLILDPLLAGGLILLAVLSAALIRPAKQ